MRVLSDEILLRPPQQARSRRLIEKVCEAAVGIVTESGLSGITTNAIADKAGVPPTSIYRFFKDKSAIIEYVHARWIEEIQNIWRDLESNPTNLTLNWQDFFLEAIQDWKRPGKLDYFAVFNHAEAFFPALEKLEMAHRRFYADFFVRQMARFGACGTADEWRDLAMYLYAIEEELYTPVTLNAFSSQTAAENLFIKTLLFHIGEIMPD